MLDPQESHPSALRLEALLDNLYVRLVIRRQTDRMNGVEEMYNEAMRLVGQLSEYERRAEAVERAMKALNEQLRIAQNRASAYQHQAQVMEEGITSAMGMLEGTAAGLRQTRTRISGRYYERE